MKHLLVLLFFLPALSAFSQSLKGTAANNELHGTEEVYLKSDFTQPQFFQLRKDYNLPATKLKDWVNQNMQLGSGVSMKLKETQTDRLGMTHHRYDQFYRNIPVKAGVYYFHERNNKIQSGNGKIFKLDIDTQPCVMAETAQKTAERHINAKQYKVNGNIIARTPNFDVTQLNAPKLIIVSENLNYKEPTLRLAWEIVIYAVEPLSHDKIYVDAITGKIIAKENRICTVDVQGTAVTKYNGTETITTDSVSPTNFRLFESGRGNGIHTLNLQNGSSGGVDFVDTDNYWNNVNPQQDEIATDAHYGAEMTYDYFFFEHGRSSYDGNGAVLISNVHYGTNYANAFWDGSTMTYGDGDPTSVLDLPLTTMDVCGHEIGHGVTEFTANLIYSGESGGLNESYSDVFGNAIEHYADSVQANWRMGEQCTSSGLGIRNMANPNEFNNPDTYLGNHWGGGVHNDSGVQNYWFYLLVMGGTGTNDLGNTYTVNPIGWYAAEQIAYRSLSVYLSPSSDYPDARFYAIKAAEDIYGGCSPEVMEVTNAWYAVGVGGPFNPVLAADFTASKLVICDLPGSTIFTALGNGISSHLWDFGDGNTSTLPSPSHTYTQPGSYSVSLHVVGCNGMLDSLTKPNFILVDPLSPSCDTITPLPVSVDSSSQCSGVFVDPGGANGDYPNGANVIFTINPPGQINFQITFDAFDTESGYDYLSVYDGPTTTSPLLGTFAGTGIPAPITSSNGSLTLHFTSDGSVTRPGFVISWADQGGSGVPMAAYSFPTPSPHNWPILFDNLSTNAGNYMWDFGDGNTATVENPTHTYLTANATFNTSLIAANCTAADTTYQSITIDSPSTLTIDPDTICVTLDQGDTTYVPVTITNTGSGIGYYSPGGSVGGNLITQSNTETFLTSGATTTHTFAGIPAFIDSVFLTIIINGDYDSSAEFAEFAVDGINQGQIVDNDVQNGTDIITTYVLTGPDLTNWLIDETLVFDVVNSPNVDINIGGDDTHEVIIQYRTLTWLNVDMLTNSTGANSQDIVDILFDARYVAGGATYVYDIIIQTNDVNNPTETIHCKLTVNANSVADFYADETLVCDGNATFFDVSQNSPFSWNWDFGDGNTSTVQNPTHQYQNPGVYDVSLIVCNVTDCDTLTRTNYINYDPTTTACLQHNLPNNSSTTLTGCTGTLFDHSGPNADYLNAANDTVFIVPPGATSITLTFTLFELESSYDYLWIYDGPSTNSPLLGSYTGNSLPPVTTSSGGALTIIMTSDNSVVQEGFEATWLCLNPTVPPTASFMHNFTNSCAGVVQFTDQSINAINWDWDFGDGTSSTLQNPSHTYPNPGTYNVTLIAGNNIGTDTFQQTVVSSPFIASAAIPDTMYTTVPELFDNTSAGLISSDWDFGNGNFSTQEDPLVVYANAGLYTVTLISVDGNGCIDTLTHLLTVLPSVGVGDTDNPEISVNLFPVPSEGPVQLVIDHPKPEDLSLKAYNSIGQLVFTLSDQSSGNYSKELNFNHLTSGVYLLQIELGDERISKRIVIQR